MCHKTPNPMKNAAKRLLKSLSPLVFKTFYTLSWSTVQGEIFLKFYLEVDIKVNRFFQMLSRCPHLSESVLLAFFRFLEVA